MKNLKNYFKGFTLVELIIVISILAILATIAFVSFRGFMADARDANRVSTITNIEKGLQVFQAKSGTLPEPDEKVTYTGGINIVIKQGLLSDNVAKTLNINITPKDPLTKNNYYYSISNNGEYYQIGTDKENQTTAGMINTAYADTTTSLVRGNYNVDPSLPSLMVVPSSVNTASGIFDPSVCFIMNGGTNTFGSNSGSCIPKSKMTLNTYDKSLVGYWDMETTFNSGGKIWVKDISGYGNDLFGSGINNKFETGGIIGKSIEFNGEGLSQTGYYESKNNIGNIFDSSLTLSVYFKKNNFFENMYQKIILIGTGSTKDNFLVGISQGNLNYSFYGLIWPEINSKYINIITGYPNLNQWNLSTLTYNKGELKFFLNGKIIGKDNYSTSGSFLEKKYLPLRVGYGYNLEYFKGIIDDVKIYNRALSDEEIRQQARIAGF